MRVVKWSLLVLLMVIVITLGGVVSLLTGLWSFNLQLNKESAWFDYVTRYTELSIETERTVFVTVGQNFSVDAGKTRILYPRNQNFVDAPLVEFGSLDVIGKLSLGVLFGGMPQVEEISLADMVVNLERGIDGRLKLPRVASMPLVPGTVPSADFALISEAQAAEHFDIRTLPIDRLNVRRALVRIIESGETKEIQIAALDFVKPKNKVDGLLRFDGAYQEMPILVDIAATRSLDVIGDITLFDMQLMLEGSIIPDDLSMDFNLTVNSTKELADFLRVDLPKGPFKSDFRVTFNRNIFQVEIAQFLTQNSDMQADLNISIKGRALIAKIRGNKLIVDDFIPVSAKTQQSQKRTKETPKSSDGRLVPDVPLPKVLRRDFFLPEFADLEVAVDFRRVSVGELELADVRGLLDLDHKGAEVKIENVTVGLGGIVAGDFRVKVGKKPEFFSDLRVKNLPISTLQIYVPAISQIDGTVNTHIKGEASGGNLREVVGSYTGSLVFSLNDGYLQVPPKAASLVKLISPSILEGGLLILQCVHLQSDWENGVDEKVEGLALSNALSFQMAGSVDLGQEQQNLNTFTDLTVLGRVLGLSTPITGSFLAPKADPDYKGFISGDVKNTLPTVNGLQSECHEKFTRLHRQSGDSYEGLPGTHALGALLEKGVLENGIQTNLGTIQEKIQKLKSGELEGVKDVVEQKLQKALQGNGDGNTHTNNLKSGLENLGKSLLKGFGN